MLINMLVAYCMQILPVLQVCLYKIQTLIQIQTYFDAYSLFVNQICSIAGN